MKATPTPEALRRRRNLVLLLVLGALTLAAGLFPTVCSYVEQPEQFYATYAEAPRRPDGFLPTLVPPSATEIHERRDSDSGRVWARWKFDPAERERMVAGLRPLSLDEAKRLVVEPPAFTAWWTINPRTMQTSQGRKIQVYEVPGDDQGWLVVDPRSNLAFYWSR